MTKASRLTKVTLYALPFTLIYGWINHLFWMVGFGNRYTPILFLAGLVFASMWYLFSENWKKADVRWLLVPIAWVITVILLPWRTFTSSSHNDVHYHILQAKNIAVSRRLYRLTKALISYSVPRWFQAYMLENSQSLEVIGFI